MANEYGSGGDMTVTMDGPFGNADPNVKAVTITLAAWDWKNAESPYTQDISPEGVSASSKIDIQPTQAQIAMLGAWGTALSIRNDKGVITAYATGGKPNASMEIPATITEVTGGGTIWGNTVGADTSTIANMEAVQTLIAEAVEQAKQYTDGKHISMEIPLPASGWAGEVPPYVQAIAVDGILPTDRPHYGVVYSDNWKAEKEEFAVVDKLDTEAGRLIFTCFEEKPVVDLTIQVEVNR